MRCRHKKNEDCGLLSFERPDFCDELCEEFVPADLPEAGASAERISSVVRSNATTGGISVKERLPDADSWDIPCMIRFTDGYETRSDYGTVHDTYRRLSDKFITHWRDIEV